MTERFFHNDCEPLRVPVIKLAFLGDAVMELMVREYLLTHKDAPFALMHKDKTRRVCATAQAAAVAKILPLLTEEELAVYKRGRNTKPHNVPKNATPGDYSKATGLETLMGYLYIAGRFERLKELFVYMQDAENLEADKIEVEGIED